MTDNINSSDPDKRGVEGLTEVLRLQAEALSRISERMAGMGQNAGKVPPPPIEKPRQNDGAHLPVLAGDPSLNEESLPVLNSFKQFLEQERRRGRKRFIWGLLGVTVVFSCVLAVIVKINFERARALKADIQLTSSRLDRSQQATDGALKKVADKADQSAAQAIAKNAATIRSDITRNILWAHSTLASNMTTELTDRDSEIARLKEKVSSLEVDNTMLARQVSELVQRVKVIEMDYLNYMEHASIEGQVAETNEAVLSMTNVAPAVGRAAPLTINSPRFGRPMQMRVPKE